MTAPTWARSCSSPEPSTAGRTPRPGHGRPIGHFPTARPACSFPATKVCGGWHAAYKRMCCEEWANPAASDDQGRRLVIEWIAMLRYRSSGSASAGLALACGRQPVRGTAGGCSRPYRSLVPGSWSCTKARPLVVAGAAGVPACWLGRWAAGPPKCRGRGLGCMRRPLFGPSGNFAEPGIDWLAAGRLYGVRRQEAPLGRACPAGVR
jgi:hypothetical protein